jgi:hypothetical protein
MTTSPAFILIGLVFLTAGWSSCGGPTDQPSRDDTALPADDGGDTGTNQCEAELERVRAELAECSAAAKPEPK